MIRWTDRRIAPTLGAVTTTLTAEKRTLPRAGFVLVAYAFGVTMLGTTLPTPLYPLYERQFAFGNLLTTVIYAVYAAGVVAALLLLGRASDIVGRRPMLLAAIGASAVSAVVFVTDAGLAVLFIGRIMSGLSAGIVTATATVALIELSSNRKRAALVATAVNMLGLGAGPLLSGLLARYAPSPLRLPFIVDIALLVVAIVAVLVSNETAPATEERWKPQRPGIAPEARTVFLPAAVAAFAAFAVFGLLTAVEPGVLATVLHRPDRALAGAVPFSMFAGSAIGQVGLARVPTRIALPAGCLVLIAGLAAIAAALLSTTLIPLIIGTIVVGIGQGMGFRAGIAAITAASPAERRSQTVASYFVIAYAGISVPVILVGIATTGMSLRAAGIAFTAAVALLAFGAWFKLVRLFAR
jgi:predicted MFS family arabinose efflux permease